MPSLDEVGVRLTTTGARQTAREIRDVRQEVRGLGDSSTVRGIGDLNSSVGGLSSSFGGLHSGLLSASSSLQTFASRGILGLGTLAATAVGFGLRAASSFEQSEIAFGTLLGSMQLGEQMLGRLQQFNLQTPFELPGLANATQQLLLYGYAGDQAFQTIKTVSDIAASSGPRMEESLGRMTLALGQIRAKGVLQGEELRQLTEAGFPALELLTELTGRTGPELRKAMETGLDPEIAEKFLAAVETGQARTFERFRGGAAAQAKTLSGVVSNLKDTLQIGLAKETQPLADTLVGNMPALQTSLNGLITATMPGVTELVSTLVEGAPGAIRLLTPVLGELTLGMADLFKQVGPHMPEIIGLFSEFIGLLPELVEIGTKLLPIVGGMIDVFEGFLDLPFGHEALGALLVTLTGYRALSSVIDTVTSLGDAFRSLADGVDAAGAADGPDRDRRDDRRRGGPALLPLGAKLGGIAAGLGLLYEGWDGTRFAMSDEGKRQRQVLGDLQQARGEDGALTGVNSFLKTAISEGIGSVPVIGAPIRRAVGADPATGRFAPTQVPALVTTGAPAVVHRTTTVGDINVYNPATEIDYRRVLQEALEEHDAERTLRR